MTAPAISLLDVADDALDALPPDASDAQRDAYASELLRVLGEAEADEARYQVALTAEIERLRERYAPMFAACAERIARYRAALHEQALAATFVGRSRSRRVGHGRYGLRHVPRAVKFTDMPALLAYAIEQRPDLVRVREVRDVPRDPVAEYVLTTGDELPGTQIEGEYDELSYKVALS